MGARLTIELTTEQAVGLIAMAAAKSWSVEAELLFLIDVALVDFLPPMSFEQVLKEISNFPPPSGKSSKSHPKG